MGMLGNQKRKRLPIKNDAVKKRKEDLEEIIERRNIRIKNFFDLCGLQVRIIGDKNSPAIVLNDNCVLNAYVHNFELRFTDKAVQGNIIYTVKLTEKPNFDKNKVLSCINDFEKRVLYKIQVKNSNPTLFLSGYNFLNKNLKEGRYPVFSSYVPKVYFSQEKAEEISSELNNDGYDLVVV